MSSPTSTTTTQPVNLEFTSGDSNLVAGKSSCLKTIAKVVGVIFALAATAAIVAGSLALAGVTFGIGLLAPIAIAVALEVETVAILAIVAGAVVAITTAVLMKFGCCCCKKSTAEPQAEAETV
jgi:hypothetical protein